MIRKEFSINNNKVKKVIVGVNLVVHGFIMFKVYFMHIVGVGCGKYTKNRSDLLCTCKLI
jgi:hypothetical protein